ncbi:MAG: winged helix-turn-helix domain-containing protein [Methanomethylovorans sp.]|uniref:helix-turn-helix transcriptional regulator n=1 Tax=Methanomethylovorans sp. TaxID=2758717 RepID=UPI000B20C7DC|nr:winged helix-turn-helix domain-containing protein [Methanomethylovorans sp.]
MKTSLIDIMLNSEKRKNLLLLLIEGGKDRNEIKTSLNVTSTAIIPQIKKLKECGLVIQEEDHYYLSDMGEIMVENMLPFLNIVEVFEENEEYWLTHDLKGIPRPLLKRLGELGNYLIIEPDLNYLFEFPKEFKENIFKSSHVETFTAYFHPEYPAIYSKLSEQGIKVSLVLTASVLDRFQKDYAEQMKKITGSKDTEVFITDDIRGLATIVTTDRFLLMCFFNKNGHYDHRIIMSFDPRALKWSRELFQLYREKATGINIDKVHEA